MLAWRRLELNLIFFIQFRITYLENGATHDGLQPPVLIKIKTIIYRHGTDRSDVKNTSEPHLGFFSQAILGYVS